MHELTETTVVCPYCNEPIDILIEPEDLDQQYIEDCQVCCKPITMQVSEGFDGSLEVCVYDENESF